jgi:hypothetical protein
VKTLQVYQPKQRYIPKHVKHEENLQKQVCSYLRMQYPHAIFRSDYASGLKLTMNQAVQHKRLQSSRSWPDLFIYSAQRGYHGLALELKKDGTRIYLTTGPRKGKLSSDLHIQEQAAMLQQLNDEGYFARFAVGFDKTQKIIDWYFGKPANAELF